MTDTQGKIARLQAIRDDCGAEGRMQFVVPKKSGEPLLIQALHSMQASRTAPPAPSAESCHCTACRPLTIDDMRFVICPDCGNKRCPHARNHRNACTGSNEPGQVGSAEATAPQPDSGRVAELEAECARLRKDAERYQLLRRGQHWSAIDGIGNTLRADDLDKAIDAALAAKGEQQ